ncbi:DUF5712 family protein [Hymenobacter endophyticus]|uniref:DUF5712 family protein n=1 Tax=Hymenobacter endophyticus TaxID=3076335 RepID=A0ABU3TKW0_9BACT|nr:DUF5712 family protein [Hymenobacter endophyticus]MDU0372004.1 DUF5712 family protein [Hymenobacter endophyticus]
MYIKVINPKTDGHDAYKNDGSSAQVVNYLRKEGLEKKEEVQFFTRDQDAISGAEAAQMIDTNVKGLTKTDAKFYSLVISPSEQELHSIGNDPVKLQAFTRDVMAVYAAEFKLANGRQLAPEEIVWAAVRHDERHYRGTDKEVQAGEAVAGAKKEGLQTHIHVLVSARDAEQKITLNPLGKADRFNRVEFAARGAAEFAMQYQVLDYTGKQGQLPTMQALTATFRRAIQGKELMSEEEIIRRQAKIGEKVAQVNLQLPADKQLDAELVKTIGQDRGFDRVFYSSLNRIGKRAEEGKPVEAPYQLLRTGKLNPGAEIAQAAAVTRRSLVPFGQGVAKLTGGQRENYTQDMSEKTDRRHERER